MPTAISAESARVRFAPHFWQYRVLTSEARDIGVVSGIRGGKTVCGSFWFLRELQSRPEGSIGLISGPDWPTMRKTTLETILNGMGPQRLGKWPDELIADYHKTEHVFTLKTGHRAMLQSGENPNSLRGPSAVCYWIDEATYCKPDLLPVLQGRVLDTKGRGLCTMTPKGKRNWFWTIMGQCAETEAGRVWTNPRWEIFRFKTRENPGVDADEVTNLGTQYDERTRQQELDAEFIDWSGAAFLGDALDRCFALPEAHWGIAHTDHPIAFGLDPAGYGQDYTALGIVCLRCRAVVDWFRVRRMQFAAQYEQVAKRAAFWRPKRFTYDRTSMGGQATGDEFEAAVMKASPGTSIEEFTFTAKTKAELIMETSARLEDGIAIPNRPELVSLRTQLRNYEWDDADLETDDVMALGLAVHGMAPLTLPVSSDVYDSGLADEPIVRGVDWARELRIT